MSEETQNTEQEQPEADDKPDMTAVVADLQSQIEKLKAKNDEILSEKKRAKEEAEKAAREAAEKSGDVDAIKSSYEKKLGETQAEYEDRINGLTKTLEEMTVTRTATELAAELALPGSAKALLPHIQSRLRMEMKDGKPVVTVLDTEGRASALSVQDLRKEFEADQAFAPLLAGTKASGGGAAGGGSGAGGASHVKANFGGSRQERTQAIKSRFKDLA